MGTKPQKPSLVTIVHTERSDLRTLIRAELKNVGIQEIQAPGSSDDCVSELVRFQSAPLILDWEIGAAEVVKILGAARGHFKIDTRPIFIIAAKVDQSILTTAWEYGVSHVHTGEISRSGIKEALRRLLEQDSEKEKEIKSALVKVAEARRRDDWAVATPLLLEMVERYPSHDQLKIELAENLINEDLWRDAEVLLAPLALSVPPNLRAAHLLARCMAHAGKMQEATELLKKASLINPYNVERLVDLGNILLDQNRVPEAREVFEEAQELAPGNADAVVGSSKCLLLEGEINDALGLLKDISGPRELAAVFNTTAILAIRHGTFDKGMNLYDAAVKAVGRNTKLQSRLWFNKGVGYRRWRKIEKALECFNTSLALDGEFEKAKRQRDLVMGAGGATERPSRIGRSQPSVDVSGGDELSEMEISPLSRKKAVTPKKVVGGDEQDVNFEEEDWVDEDF